MIFETAKGLWQARAGPNYPAPVEAIKTIRRPRTLVARQSPWSGSGGLRQLAKKTSAAQSLIDCSQRSGTEEEKDQGTRRNRQGRGETGRHCSAPVSHGWQYRLSSRRQRHAGLMKDINEHGIEQNDRSRQAGGPR